MRPPGGSPRGAPRAPPRSRRAPAPQRSRPERAQERDPLRRRLQRRLARRARPRSGASFSSALSPMPGIDACPASPAVRDLEAEHPLLADAQRVEAPAADLEDVAAALVDARSRRAPCRDAPSTATAAPRLPPVSSSATAAISSSPRRAPALAPERAGSGDLGRDLALHVLRAAPADLAVRRCLRPTGRRSSRRGSAVTVSVWPSRQSVGPLGLAAQPGEQVRPPRLGGEQLALEPGVGERARPGAPAPAPRCPGGFTVSIADQS